MLGRQGSTSHTCREIDHDGDVRHDDRFDLYDDHHTSCGWEKAVCEMGTTMCVSLPDEMKHFSTSGQGDGVLIKTVVESQES